MTPEQQAACLADVDKVLAHANVVGVGKVREEPAFTNPETGERFGPSWVAEVRIRRPGSLRVVTLDAEEHAADPSAWCEMLDADIRRAAGRR